VVVPAIASAGMQGQNQRYRCEHDVKGPVIQAHDADQAIAILLLEARQIPLCDEPAASVARFGWPSDGASHV